MKMRSLELLAVLAVCSSAVYACSSDDPVPAAPPDGPDASSGGGSGSGGKATGGRGGTGGGVGTGGATGGRLGTTPDSGPDGAPEAGSGGASGAAGAGGAGGGGAGGAGGGGAGGGGGSAGCALCTTGYPDVPYPAENKHSDAKAMLGKILFWDEQLGELNTMACGTCHRGAAGGSDPRSALAGSIQPGPNGATETHPNILSDDIRGGMGTPVCAGPYDGGAVPGGPVQVTQRKPPTYLDAMFSLGVFWDGRAGYCGSTGLVDGCFQDPDTGNVLIQGQIDSTTQKKVGGALEAQAVGPPLSPVEMACSNQTWPRIHQKLKTAVPLAVAQTIPADMTKFIVDNHNKYPEMFAAAFGADAKVSTTDPNDVINTRRIAYAIATHERRLKSDQTPWDEWNAGKTSAMTAQQIQGFSLFMGKAKCGVCHTPPMFTDLTFHFLGFHDPNIANNEDVTGLQKITKNLADKGKFKTPTLRNVGLREAGGLLHSGDGPGHDLNTVMEMYKNGGRRAEPAILSLIDGQLLAVALNTTEIADIIEFMRNGLTDLRVKNETAPFDRPKLGSEP